MPGLAEAHRAEQRRPALAADPDRHAAAVVAFVGPGGRDGRQMFVGDPAALVVGHSQGLELLPRPPDPDAQHQPAAAEVVEVGRHAGHQQRMAIGDDQHRGAERDARGDAGQPGERGERLVEGGGILRGDVGGDRHMVGDHEQIEPEPFHRLRPVADHAGVGARAEIGDVHT